MVKRISNIEQGMSNSEGYPTRQSTFPLKTSAVGYSLFDILLMNAPETLPIGFERYTYLEASGFARSELHFGSVLIFLKRVAMPWESISLFGVF